VRFNDSRDPLFKIAAYGTTRIANSPPTDFEVQINPCIRPRSRSHQVQNQDNKVKCTYRRRPLRSQLLPPLPSHQCHNPNNISILGHTLRIPHSTPFTRPSRLQPHPHRRQGRWRSRPNWNLDFTQYLINSINEHSTT